MQERDHDVVVGVDNGNGRGEVGVIIQNDFIFGGSLS